MDLKKHDNTSSEADPRVGLWFHQRDSNREIMRQGQIVGGNAARGYRCQLYSYLDGNPTAIEVIFSDQMEGWSFYATDADMRRAYNREVFKVDSDD